MWCGLFHFSEVTEALDQLRHEVGSLITMDPSREPIVTEEVLVEKYSGCVCRLIPCWNCLGISCKVVRFYKHVFDASLGRFNVQVVDTDDFHWCSRCDVDQIRCSGRQCFPADASITLLDHLLEVSVHPRPVTRRFIRLRVLSLP